MKLTTLLFYFLMFTNFLFIGMIIIAVLGFGESQGLAGGAIILFYGIISAVISLFVSFSLIKHLTSKSLKKVNRILLILFAIFLILFTYRLISLQKDDLKSSGQWAPTKVVS